MMTITNAHVQEALSKLPAHASLEEVMETLQVLHKIAQGIKDEAEGNVISHEEIKKYFGLA